MIAALVAASSFQPGLAQDVEPDTVGTIEIPAPAPRSLDVRLLYGLHHTESEALRLYARTADATAYPVFLAAPVAAWAYAGIAGGPEWEHAYLHTLSEVGAIASFSLLKRVFHRPRPYEVHPDVVVRARALDDRLLRRDSFAFPSGHAAMAFSIATSWTIAHPRWYVAAPGFVWAAGVAVSRVWLGVHYPTDVLAGAALGAGVAGLVHALGSHITPSALRHGDGAAGPAPISLRISLP
jgi:membrane-associated phospholipid phosphatase